jgi:hypothetical protein
MGHSGDGLELRSRRKIGAFSATEPFPGQRSQISERAYGLNGMFRPALFFQAALSIEMPSDTKWRLFANGQQGAKRKGSVFCRGLPRVGFARMRAAS